MKENIIVLLIGCNVSYHKLHPHHSPNAFKEVSIPIGYSNTFILFADSFKRHQGKQNEIGLKN